MSRFKLFNFLKLAPFLIRHRNVCRRIHLSISNQDISKSDLKTLLENAASFSEKNPLSDAWYTPVYPKRIRLQSSKSIRPEVDPSSTTVMLFPGQGSQYVGMAKNLLGYPNVKEMFDCASEILRYDLLDLCVNGPEDMLNMTVNSQVAVMVSSLAAVEKLRADSEEMIKNCAATAGFSVGEYAALVFAGALDFENAVRLLKIRGEAMQAASDMEPGGMMTVFLTPSSKVKMACAAARKWCEEQTIYNAECKVAIYLFPDCRVVSGHVEALKFLESNAAKFGIKKIKYLPVSGAFHTKLMEPAKEVLKKALNATPFEVPLIPVHANVGGRPYVSVEEIRTKLAQQLSHPVEWEQIMHILFERSQGTAFPNVYECGPGTSMKSILRYNNNLAYKKCLNILA